MKSKTYLGIIGLTMIIIAFCSLAILAFLMPIGSPDEKSPLFIKTLDIGLSYWIREKIFPPPLIIFGWLLCSIEIFLGWKTKQEVSKITKFGFGLGLFLISFWVIIMLTAYTTHVN